MDPLTLLGLVGAGVSAWLVHRHQRDHDRRRREQEPRYEDDAEVAVAVAGHMAGTREHPFLASLHLLYGLLQDETIAAALGRVGVGAEAVEDAVLAALAGPEPTRADASATAWLLARVHAAAKWRGRAITGVDLWAGLTSSPTAAAELLATTGVDAVAVLAYLYHGADEPTVATSARAVAVIIRDDDYTPQALVREVLERIFGLSPAAATACIGAAEATGRAVIGRFAAAEARPRIATARRLARAEKFPLWIGTDADDVSP